ncbi:hypothetical protein [Arthrobacter sp. 2MCAF14]|uniref:hypothetical protein n=1 Tax=Arthrobacter sp. 2MCAF14 TaxID=3232982 RepID=UPI003F8EB605
MTIDFDPIGNAVDSGRVQTALGFNRARLNALVTANYNHGVVTTNYDHGVGAALPRPVGVLGGTMIWDVHELEAALPAILEARQNVKRNAPRIEREPVTFEALAARREDYEGIPHVLGLMDAEMIAEHFGVAPRYPGEWAERKKLLPPPVGVVGAPAKTTKSPRQRRVWAVEDVKAHEEQILKHLARRRELAERR